MVWEAAQDCRMHEIVRGSATHVVTCPRGNESSLLVALVAALGEQGDSRARAASGAVREAAGTGTAPEREEL